MTLKASADLIGEHTTTGADPDGRVHKLGAEVGPGAFNRIGSTKRIFQFTGMDGTQSIDLQGSLDGGQNWVTWASPITTNTAVIVDDGPILMRSYCQTLGSGAGKVYAQKFIEDK